MHKNFRIDYIEKLRSLSYKLNNIKEINVSDTIILHELIGMLFYQLQETNNMTRELAEQLNLLHLYDE